MYTKDEVYETIIAAETARLALRRRKAQVFLDAAGSSGNGQRAWQHVALDPDVQHLEEELMVYEADLVTMKIVTGYSTGVNIEQAT